jgi:hypothetical protein
MGAGSVLWTETPDDDRDETDEIEAHGRVDESFAARRLRYWLRACSVASRLSRTSHLSASLRNRRQMLRDGPQAVS